MPPTRDLSGSPGMCPGWESNRWPFGLQSGAQPTEPHQPGQISVLEYQIGKVYLSVWNRKDPLNYFVPRILLEFVLQCRPHHWEAGRPWVKNPLIRDVCFPSCSLTHPWGQVRMGSYQFSSLPNCEVLSLMNKLTGKERSFWKEFHRLSLFAFFLSVHILQQWFFPHLFDGLWLHLVLGKKKSF